MRMLQKARQHQIECGWGGGPQNATGGHLIVNHPLHLLLADPSHAANGWFLINNRDALPADASLEAYDTSGALLLVDYFDVAGEGSRRVAWADLPAGTASIVLTSTNYVDAGLNVSIARGSPMIFGESQSRDLNLPPTTTNGTDILLYNPSEQTANVDLQGETTTSEILWPHELRTVAPISGENGIQVSANQQIVVATSAPVTNQSLQLSLSLTENGGACAYNDQRQIECKNFYGATRPYHSGRDYGGTTSTAVRALSYGRLKYRYAMPVTPECAAPTECKGKPDHGLGNVLEMEHLLSTGETIYSSYNHLNRFEEILEIESLILKNQVLGYVGGAGQQRIDYWVPHLHLEMKSGWYGICGNGATKACEHWGSTAGSPDDYGYRDPNRYLNVASVLIPFFSRDAATPSATDYDVYGTAGATLHSALPLRPVSQKTFTNVGVGGRLYSSESTITNSFICATAILTSTSAPLTRNSSACNQATGSTTFTVNDYKFFAISDDFKFLADSDKFKRGYELKFSILPANSEIVDNDGRLVDATANTTTSNRAGYFASSEAGALDRPGYFLTAKLFTAGSSNWARWFPANSRTYEVWVHVPKGATATNVSYKVYPKGRPADDSCSTTNTVNPCYQTDDISHNSNQDRWVRLAAAGVNQFSFVASSTNAGYVGLAGTSIVGGTGGADAVKFLQTSATAVPDLVISAFSASPTTVAPGGSIGLSAASKNQGTGASPSSTTLTYRRSTDATITSSDTSVCTDSVAALAAGATEADSCTVSAPTTTGTYYYGACLTSVSGESSTSNNCSTAVKVTVSSSTAKPDLVVSALSGPSSATRGLTMSISYSIKNQGTASANPNYSRAYLSTNTTITTSDTAIWTCNHSSGIAAGSTRSCSGSPTVPSTLTPGTYYLGVIADYSNVIAESNESNNTAYGTITIK